MPMKIYNMRNNEALTDVNEELLEFLKLYLLNEGESDDDFFINTKNIILLEEKAETEEEKELVKVLKETLANEKGKVGLDIYYE